MAPSFKQCIAVATGSPLPWASLTRRSMSPQSMALATALLITRQARSTRSAFISISSAFLMSSAFVSKHKESGRVPVKRPIIELWRQKSTPHLRLLQALYPLLVVQSDVVELLHGRLLLLWNKEELYSGVKTARPTKGFAPFPLCLHTSCTALMSCFWLVLTEKKWSTA